MQKFFDYMPDAVVRCRIIRDEETGKIDLFGLYANKHMEILTGLANDEIVGQYMLKMFPELDDSIFEWPKILSEIAMTNENKIIEQYVSQFDKYFRINVFGYDGDSFFVIITDVTDKREIKRKLLERDRQIKHLESQIKSIANVDSLTKLYNFQYVYECIENNIENYKDESDKFCILIIDIDEFKEINHKYGINFGDATLQKISGIVTTNARKIDVVGRYGSDRYIAVLNNVEIDIAKIIVEKLKQALLRENPKEISVCGALTEFNGETAKELLYKSEQKLKKAKSMGRGTIIS